MQKYKYRLVNHLPEEDVPHFVFRSSWLRCIRSHEGGISYQEIPRWEGNDESLLPEEEVAK